MNAHALLAPSHCISLSSFVRSGSLMTRRRLRRGSYSTVGMLSVHILLSVLTQCRIRGGRLCLWELSSNAVRRCRTRNYKIQFGSRYTPGSRLLLAPVPQCLLLKWQRSPFIVFPSLTVTILAIKESVSLPFRMVDSPRNSQTDV